jgi:putative colanic acid biosynthesis glycosyltransferase
MPILTIVSVTFEDEAGIMKTLHSLDYELPGDVQVLVIDGSPRLKPSFAARLEGGVPYTLIREKDNGIYDGMNRGIEKATGDYLWFLNGGDESLIHDWSAFVELLRKARKRDVGILFFDYEMVTGKRSISRRSRRPTYIWHGLPTSHQAILYRRQSIPAHGYPSEYRMAGDYALTALMLRDRAIVAREGRRIARFDGGGFSATHARLIAIEARSVQESILFLPRWRVQYSRFRHQRSRLARDLLRHLAK